MFRLGRLYLNCPYLLVLQWQFSRRAMQSMSPRCSAGLHSATTRKVVPGTARRDTLRHGVFEAISLGENHADLFASQGHRSGKLCPGMFRKRLVEQSLVPWHPRGHCNNTTAIAAPAQGLVSVSWNTSTGLSECMHLRWWHAMQHVGGGSRNTHVQPFIGPDRRNLSAYGFRSSCFQDISDDTASLLSALTLQCCNLQVLQRVAYNVFSKSQPTHVFACFAPNSSKSQRLPGNRIGDHGVKSLPCQKLVPVSVRLAISDDWRKAEIEPLYTYTKRVVHTVSERPWHVKEGTPCHSADRYFGCRLMLMRMFNTCSPTAGSGSSWQPEACASDCTILCRISLRDKDRVGFKQGQSVVPECAIRP